MQKVSKGPGYTEVIEEVEDGNMATKGWGFCGTCTILMES